MSCSAFGNFNTNSLCDNIIFISLIFVPNIQRMIRTFENIWYHMIRDASRARPCDFLVKWCVDLPTILAIICGQCPHNQGGVNPIYQPVLTDKCYWTYILWYGPHFTGTMDLPSSTYEIVDACQYDYYCADQSWRVKFCQKRADKPLQLWV